MPAGGCGEGMLDGSPVARRSSIMRDGALVGLAIGVLLVGWVSRAAWPSLATSAPALALMTDVRSPLYVVLRPKLSLQVFLVCGFVGLYATDPIFFAVGRRYGSAGSEHLRRLMPWTFAGLAFTTNVMARSRGLVVVATSGRATCMVAGTAGVGWGPFLLMDAAGTVLRLALLVWVGARVTDVSVAVGDFVAEYQLPLTALSLSLVMVDVLRGGRLQARRSGQVSDRGTD